MMADFAELLKRAMGLDAASIGTASVERAVQQRVAATGSSGADAYLEHVRGSREELQELIEAVVVPETWFFRDREAFAALARVAGEEWFGREPTRVRRILSLPCSTGEEPYTIAMALLEAGMPAEAFRVDAFDISARSLANARRAIYGRNSFRGSDLSFRDRFFAPAGTGWVLDERVRAQVEFRTGNVLDAATLPGPGTCDAVFCRNLLIYFDRETQDRAIANLGRLLTPQGWFFVGPSETGLLLTHAYVSAKVPLAFAFRPAAALPKERPAAAPAPVRRAPPARAPLPSAPLPFSSVVPRATVAVAERPATGQDRLAEAMQLADQGQLVEAAKAGEAHLEAQGPSAQVFYVLGLVRDASGNHTEAAHYYRKALYLDPEHHDSLVHLAVLLAGQGDKAGAKIMNDRARRSAAKQRK